jgi:hypothetical protein
LLARPVGANGFGGSAPVGRSFSEARALRGWPESLIARRTFDRASALADPAATPFGFSIMSFGMPAKDVTAPRR